MRKLTAALVALTLTFVSIAPAAYARDGRHGSYSRHYDRHYGRGYRHHNGDAAVAAGVVGLVLGLALGSAMSEPRAPRARCYDNYQRCGPQQGYAPNSYPPDASYDPNQPPPGYYDDRRAEYERDYGGPPQQRYADSNACVQQEQQWDPYSGRYVWVNVRKPC